MLAHSLVEIISITNFASFVASASAKFSKITDNILEYKRIYGVKPVALLINDEELIRTATLFFAYLTETLNQICKHY